MAVSQKLAYFVHFFSGRVPVQHVDWSTWLGWTCPTLLHERCLFTYIFLTNGQSRDLCWLWADILHLWVMAMNGYYTLLRSLELEPHYLVLFSVMPRTLLWGGFYHSAGDSVCVFLAMLTGGMITSILIVVHGIEYTLQKLRCM